MTESRKTEYKSLKFPDMPDDDSIIRYWIEDVELPEPYRKKEGEQ